MEQVEQSGTLLGGRGDRQKRARTQKRPGPEVGGYLPLGVSATAGFRPLSSDFFTSGTLAGLRGVPAGEAPGLCDGAGVAATVGATVGFGVGVFAGEFGAGVEQAPNTAAEAAKTVDNMIDLLIVFSFMLTTGGLAC